MKNLKYRAAVILLITIMCFSILLSANIIRIAPAKGYLTWGTYGQGNSQFDYPADVCVYNSYVYVLDTDNDRVQQFDTEGHWIRSWGSTGSGNNQFDNPYGICTDASGNVWVADYGNNRIQEFDSTGSWLRSYGSQGTGVGNFYWPWDVAADNFGHIYVSDWWNHRIVKLDVTPTSIDWAGSWGSEGTGDYQFEHLAGIACDADGNVFVTDMLNNRVQVFDSDGVFVGKWGSLGSGDGQFGQNSPWGIAVDGAEVYVADVLNSRIEKFYFYIPQNAIGRFNWAFGSAGSGQGQFLTPNGVCVDNAHNIYVADSSNNRIQKFTQYTLTLRSNDPSGYSYNYVNPYEGEGKYPEGSVVTLTAVTTHGYAFTGWNGSYSGMDNPTTITMNGDKEVWANFALPFQASYSTVVPTIDGVIGAEWDDANSYALDLPAISWQIPPPWDPPSVPATASFKHDGTNIYIGLKVFDADHVTDEFSVYFDEGNDGAHGSGTRDFVLTNGQEDCKSVFDPYMTDDGYWQNGFYVPVMGGGDFTARCTYNVDHWEVEFAIPFVGNDAGTPGTDLSDLTCTVADTVGIKIQYCRWMGPFAINYFYPPFWQSNVETFTTLSFAPPPPQGLTITSTVDDPSLITEPWSYLLTYPDGYTESFTLPAGGGSTLLPITQSGDYSIAQTRKLNYATSTTVDGIDVPATEVANKVSLTLSNLDAGDAVSVVFNNVLVPDVAWAKPAGGGDSSQNSASTYNMPCRKAVPVQVSWDPDIEPNQELDIVKDRPIKIMVNLADLLTSSGPLGAPLASTDSVTVSVTCTPAGFFVNPLEYSATRTGAQISSNNVIIFNMNPPSTIGHYTITCTTTHGADTLSTIFTLVKVRETAPLSLYYSHLYRVGDYGTEPAAAFDTMLTNSRDFVKAVYPVSGLAVGSNANGIPGEAYQANYIGMLKDCQRIEQEAKLSFPNSPNAIGVAIGPDLGGGGYQNYFAYHGAAVGKKTAVGVSFGPAVKGVAVLDGYYSAAAHEIGHTFGLYYGVPEQYVQYNPGAPANGFWAEQNQWRSGYDFMGLSSHESTTSTWVSTETTFEPLFSGLKTSDDPQIILVNGIIYKDAEGVTSAELPFTWYSMPYGTADTIPTGEVSRFVLRFYLDDETIVETGFDAQFFLNLDPGIEAGEDLPLDIISGDVPIFGTIPVNFAGFAFATEYPQGTVQIDLVDTFQAPEDQVIATIDPEDVVSALSAGFGGFLPPIKNDGSSSFKSGSAVPVKFQLISSGGTFITTAQATLFLSFEGIGPEILATSLPKSTSGNLFRYDVAKNQYVFNLDTRSLKKGIWELRVYLGDGTIKTVNIRLR